MYFEITTKLERYFKFHFVQQNPWLYTHFSILSVSLHHLCYFLTLRYRFQKTQIAYWSWIAYIWGKRASGHKHISLLRFLTQPQVHEPTQRTVPILWAVLRLHWLLCTTRWQQTPSTQPTSLYYLVESWPGLDEAGGPCGWLGSVRSTLLSCVGLLWGLDSLGLPWLINERSGLDDLEIQLHKQNPGPWAAAEQSIGDGSVVSL